MNLKTFCQNNQPMMKIITGLFTIPLLWVWYVIICSHPKVFISLLYQERLTAEIHSENALLVLGYYMMLFTVTSVIWRQTKKSFYLWLLCLQFFLMYAFAILLLTGLITLK